MLVVAKVQGRRLWMGMSKMGLEKGTKEKGREKERDDGGPEREWEYEIKEFQSERRQT